MNWEYSKLHYNKKIHFNYLLTEIGYNIRDSFWSISKNHISSTTLITAGWTQLDKRLIESLTAWNPKMIRCWSPTVTDILLSIISIYSWARLLPWWIFAWDWSLKHFSRLDMILLVPPQNESKKLLSKSTLKTTDQTFFNSSFLTGRGLEIMVVLGWMRKNTWSNTFADLRTHQTHVIKV